MKRQFAILFALTFMVSGMATMAEQAAQETEVVENEIVESAQTEWTAPFEDGDWLSIPEWNAEVYLPAGWTLTEVTETGFIASDAENAQTMNVTIEDFLTEETAESEETAEAVEAEAAEEAAENAEIEGVGISEFESYLMGLGEEYELALMGEREAAVFSSGDSVSVRFVQGSHLVTMNFAPAIEGTVSDSALSVAGTFYIYDEAEDVELTIEETEENTAETDAE